MINATDLLILAGVGCALAGCWLLGLPHGLVGSGLAVIVAAVVAKRIYVERRDRRR